MIIHVVKSGETLESISEKYNLPPQRLILENGITNPKNLVVGQTIVIISPLITHTVNQGDTLAGIAQNYNITVMQILRNNPYLVDREVLYTGETIVISYDTKKIGEFAVSGYTYPFISNETLRKTLPYLTYLTIYNYQYTMEGNIIDINDTDIINMAKNYGVAPMMLLSTLSEKGIGSSEVANNMLNNLDVQNNLINNVMKTLKEKGYYGLNIYLKYLRPENRLLVEAYIKRFSERLRSEGYRILITVTPRTNIEGTEITYEAIDYSTISEVVDGMLFLSYDWSYSFGPPASVTPFNIVNEIIINTIKLIPSEKIFLGFPVIGYDWPLPYIPGHTVARAVTIDVAIELAVLANAEIQYNKISEAPYFLYTNEMKELHIVWFKDARSIDALSDLVPEYNLQGLSIWNIMQFFTQLWFIINNKFDIQKVSDLEPTNPSLD